MDKIEEYMDKTKDQTAAMALNAKEKVQSALQDARASKELKQGISELEALPEINSSILYMMELETMINGLKGLILFINDNRMDDASVAEEIRKFMSKTHPSDDTQSEEPGQQITDEERAIENAKSIAYSSCTKALETLNM